MNTAQYLSDADCGVCSTGNADAMHGGERSMLNFLDSPQSKLNGAFSM